MSKNSYRPLFVNEFFNIWSCLKKQCHEIFSSYIKPNYSSPRLNGFANNFVFVKVFAKWRTPHQGYTVCLKINILWKSAWGKKYSLRNLWFTGIFFIIMSWGTTEKQSFKNRTKSGSRYSVTSFLSSNFFHHATLS